MANGKSWQPSNLLGSLLPGQQTSLGPVTRFGYRVRRAELGSRSAGSAFAQAQE
jgi:hypothetical protein